MSLKDVDGIWKFEEVNVTPLVVANYSTGWGNGSIAPLPTEVPEFLPITRIRSAKLLSDETNTIANPNIADFQRQLNKSAPYDGVENMASARLLRR